MSVLDFLKVKKSAPASQIAEMETSLARLRTERKEFETVVESHGARRADALLSDMADADIAKLDADASLAQIRLERLELAELELVERIERARDKAERERLASEHERAAGQIETATKALEAPLAALAVAFAELVKAIPAETFLRKYSDRHTMAQPASPEDVARAILGNALYVAAPSIFETQKCRSAFAPYGAGVERALYVSTFGSGLVTPFNKGLIGEECAIHPAPVAADQLIVAPLREKARTLREGVAERLEAAE
jgi:hypothetical protein